MRWPAVATYIDRRRGVRLAIIFAALGLIAGSSRWWILQGLVLPVRVSGDSMAPTVLGLHFRVTCPGCQFSMPLSATASPGSRPITCSNCGRDYRPAPVSEPLPGDRLIINRTTRWQGGLDRWQMVALEDPRRKDRLLVKRLVGLPGETITIDQGEVWVNGRIARKSWNQLKSLAILVHDHHYRPASEPHQARWRADAKGAWQTRGGGFRWQPPDAAPTPLQWLTYHHVACYPQPAVAGQRAEPVVDHYGVNQARSRMLHAVGDLLLACRLHAPTQGVAALRLHDGWHLWQAEWVQTARQVRLLRDGAEVKRWPVGGSYDQQAVTAQLAAIDHRIYVALAGEVFGFDYVPPSAPRQPSAQPLAVAVAGGPWGVERLQVFRDLYYIATGKSSSWRLTADQIFVLGDNCPVSLDSRDPAFGPLAGAQVLGTVHRHPLTLRK